MTGSLTSGVMDITAYALDGLSRRAEVRANNIANATTPGFRATTIDFESTLRSHLQSGDTSSLRADPAMRENLRDGFVSETGNSVDLEVETTDMIQDNLMFQAVINGFNYKVNVLRTAIGSR
jgi:flagellar basal-body rod protein FlgB